MTKFTEAKLEQAFIELISGNDMPHFIGEEIARDPAEVLIKYDLQTYLKQQCQQDEITQVEIEAIIRQLKNYPASDL